ncbi:hypothetical protein MLDJOKPK_00039 [Salmonella phage SPAsTU]|nr:hypothetical protein MLDJOKPK_00039 [Salmonella phage SPAsTU]
MLIALHVVVILLALVGIGHLFSLPRFTKDKDLAGQLLFVFGAAITGIIVGVPYMMLVIAPLIREAIQ